MAIDTRSTTDITAEMNSTPLIDVMLVLLILFIVTVPLQTHAVKLDASAGSAPPPPVVVTLQIDFDGATYWNGRAVDRATLDDLLRNVARQYPQPVIHVAANRLARYDGVAKVLADAQRLGVTRIGFVNTNGY
jgi:biopolymer transport protein ExbD